MSRSPLVVGLLLAVLAIPLADTALAQGRGATSGRSSSDRSRADAKSRAESRSDRDVRARQTESRAPRRTERASERRAEGRTERTQVERRSSARGYSVPERTAQTPRRRSVSPAKAYSSSSDRRYHRGEWWTYEAPRRDVWRPKRGGPPFCRSGQGHPRWGYGWCVDKGFAPPRHRAHWRYRPYDRVVVVHHAPVRVVRPRVTFEARIMIDLLGTYVYADIVRYGRERGYHGEPVARWVPIGTSGWVLQVQQDGYPIAELVDFDGDRRIDDVWYYEDY